MFKKTQWLKIDIDLLRGKKIAAIQKFRKFGTSCDALPKIKEAKNAIEERQEHLREIGLLKHKPITSSTRSYVGLLSYETTLEGVRFLEKHEKRNNV